MDKYYVADSYKSWDMVGNPFDKNGKLYQKVKTKCDRCGGLGIIVSRVENGRPIPIPVDGGICYACLGQKYVTKEVRLYTESEYNNMQRAKERAKERREAEQEAKIQAEFAHNKEIWLQTNGFNKDESTYIVLGDSYSIKDTLKEAGFHFNGVLRRWMKGEPTGIPEDYNGEVVKVEASSIIEFSAWGEGHFLSNAKEYVDNLEKELIPTKPSEWYGEVGERIPAIQVKLIRKRGYESRYGYSTIYTFESLENNATFVWFTKSDIHKDEGDIFSIVGTVKSHDEYQEIKQTILSRVKVKS